MTGENGLYDAEDFSACGSGWLGLARATMFNIALRQEHHPLPHLSIAFSQALQLDIYSDSSYRHTSMATLTIPSYPRSSFLEPAVVSVEKQSSSVELIRIVSPKWGISGRDRNLFRSGLTLEKSLGLRASTLTLGPDQIHPTSEMMCS